MAVIGYSGPKHIEKNVIHDESIVIVEDTKPLKKSTTKAKSKTKKKDV